MTELTEYVIEYQYETEEEKFLTEVVTVEEMTGMAALNEVIAWVAQEPDRTLTGIITQRTADMDVVEELALR